MLKPEWKEKRLKILKRDKFKCCRCGSGGLLHVHHVHYIKDMNPWECPDCFLVTVCADCHKFYHDKNPISSIPYENIVRGKPRKTRSKPKKMSQKQRDLWAWKGRMKKKYNTS